MSFQERNFKKRKTTHPDLDTSKPSARFTPTAGRAWTLSIAVPASIISDLRTGEQRIRLPGQIGRALAVFSVDEVVIFDDRPPHDRRPTVDTEHDYTGDTDPAHFLHHVLSYLEAPPFMRRQLFPIHRNLQLAGHLPSLDMPHHPSLRDAPPPYREGVVVDPSSLSSPSSQEAPGRPKPTLARHPDGEQVEGSHIDIGLRQTLFLPSPPHPHLPPKTRVTLHLPDGEHGPATAVAPDVPRKEAGYYWGYTVRKTDSLSAVFTECPFPGGYDVSVGTSERGTPVSQAFPVGEKSPGVVGFSHLMIVFGGPRGLEYAAMNDAELSEMGIQGRRTRELFDHWVNVLPGQGSRTIRTEEAVFIGLTALRRVWDDS